MKSFAEMVDFDALFAEVKAKKGIEYSKEDQDAFKTHTLALLKDYDGSKAITTDLGATASSWLYDVFAFIQSLFGGSSTSKPSGEAPSFLDKLTNAGKTTGQFSALNDLNQATIRLDTDFKTFQSGKFAAIADLVSGQTESATTPEKLNNGIYEQIRKNIDLPWGASASLNHNNVGNQVSNYTGSPQSLPNVKTNTPLTRG